MPRRQLWQPQLHSKHRTRIQPCVPSAFASCPAHPHPHHHRTALCVSMSFMAVREEAVPRLLLFGDAVHNGCPQDLNLKCVYWCVNAVGPWSCAHERQRALQPKLAHVAGWKGIEGNGSRAATASSSPEPLQALMLLAGGATHLRPGD